MSREPSPRLEDSPEGSPSRPLGLVHGEAWLRRPGCIHECVAHEVFVDTEGGVVYWGEYGVPRLGVHYGHVDPARARDLVRAAIDHGYFDTERVYIRSGGDSVPAFSSVIVDGRHHHVINEDEVAPAVVRDLEHGLEALLSETAWEPDRNDAVDSDACASFGEAVARRCLPRLRLASGTDDCERWFLAWPQLRSPREEPTVQAARCARMLESLETLDPVPTGASLEDSLGPICKRNLARVRRTCVASLRGSSSDTETCTEAGALTGWILRVTQAGGREGSVPFLERYCTSFDEDDG